MSDNQNDYALYKILKQFFLENEIAHFHFYLDHLDQVLNEGRQQVSNNIEQLKKDSLDLDQYDEWRKELGDLKGEAEQLKRFSNLLRQSFLTSLYSFMELWLRRDCYNDSKRRDNGISYKDSGKGIEGAKKYFSQIMLNDYDFNSQDWQWITNFKRLRDCIVHRQGSLTGFSDYPIDSTLASFVDQENGLSLFGVDNKQIFIEREFCSIALVIIHRFMLEILIFSHSQSPDHPRTV